MILSFSRVTTQFTKVGYKYNGTNLFIRYPANVVGTVFINHVNFIPGKNTSLYSRRCWGVVFFKEVPVCVSSTGTLHLRGWSFTTAVQVMIAILSQKWADIGPMLVASGLLRACSGTSLQVYKVIRELDSICRTWISTEAILPSSNL